MTETFTHASIFSPILKKLPKDTPQIDKDILLDIILSVADKNGSIQKFYKEVSVYSGFLTLGVINMIADKYRVHIIYKDFIAGKFKHFEDILFTIERKSCDMKREGLEVSFDLEAWCPESKNILSRSDTLAIEKAGGLETIIGKLYENGYVQYLRRLYDEAADERAISKYSSAYEKERERLARSTDAG